MAEVANTPLSSSGPEPLADQDRSRTVGALPAEAAPAPDGLAVEQHGAVRDVDSSPGEDLLLAPGAATRARVDGTSAEWSLDRLLAGERAGLAAPGGEWKQAISGVNR
jgi:hypothetical protein